MSAAARQLLRTLVMEHQTIEEWDSAPGAHAAVVLLWCSCIYISVALADVFCGVAVSALRQLPGFKSNNQLQDQLHSHCSVLWHLWCTQSSE